MLNHDRGCVIVVFGHFPSSDNLAGLRSRNIDIVRSIGDRWVEQSASCRGLLGCLAAMASSVYCPTTLRHRSTASLVCNVLGIGPPVADRRLNGIDYGDYCGLPATSTPSPSLHLSRPYPRGESWNQVAKRWRSFFCSELRNHDGKAVILAGQSGTAQRMLRHICDGIELEVAVSSTVDHFPFFERSEAVVSSRAWLYRW